MSFEKPVEININDAVIKIEGLRVEIMQMGANDVENRQINFILSQLKDGKNTPKQAIESVEMIRDSKSTYH